MQAYPQVGAVFARMRMIGEDSRPIRRGTRKLPFAVRRRGTFDFDTLMNTILVHNNFLPTPSLMLRRSVIEKIGGFDERQFLTSAYLERWLWIARQDHEISIIDRPLLKYRTSLRRFGGQYNTLRTMLAAIIEVFDHYLSQPGVRVITQPQSLAFSELISETLTPCAILKRLRCGDSNISANSKDFSRVITGIGSTSIQRLL